MRALTVAFVAVLVIHGLIHAMGFAKAFGLARLGALTMPISRPIGVAWLAATLLFVAAAAAWVAAPSRFFALGAAAVVISEIVIVLSWRDARVGTVANVIALAGVVYAGAAFGPFGLRAEYDRRVALGRAAQTRIDAPVTEAELAPLPPPVQRYLRFVGAVGKPHVTAFRARFVGRIRSGPDAPWMELRGEQHNFVEPPTRLFFMNATMRGMPVDGLHAYDEAGATMRVKVLSLLPVVDARGDGFTRTETVTVLNDMCVMAPATLVGPNLRWEPVDDRHARVFFTRAPHTVSAVLVFGDDGALVDFESDDRPSLAPDGKTFVAQRWSTPVGSYVAQGGVRLASRGEARYSADGKGYAYLEIDDLRVSYDLASAP